MDRGKSRSKVNRNMVESNKKRLPSFSVVKNLPANAGDAGSIPGSGRSGEGNSNPPQYSCLKNSMDRGA